MATAACSIQAAAYISVELALITLALVACLATLRRYPGLALFGLFVLFVSLFKGHAGADSRYILAAPSIYLFLSRLGRSHAFDRGWTTASLLTMGLLATLFTFDMWVA